MIGLHHLAYEIWLTSVTQRLNEELTGSASLNAQSLHSRGHVGVDAFSKKKNNNERFTSIHTADCNTLRDITVAFFQTKSGMAELYPGLKRLITS